MISRFALPVGLALACIGLAGCGAGDAIGDQIAEKAVEQAAEAANGEGSDVEIDTSGEGGISVESEDGSFSVGGGDLPEQFPDSLPLPDSDYEVASSFASDSDDGLHVQVTLFTDTEQDALVDDFAEALPGAGYEINDTVETSIGEATSVQYMTTGHDQSVMVQIGENPANDNQTMVSYVVMPEEDTAA